MSNFDEIVDKIADLVVKKMGSLNASASEIVAAPTAQVSSVAAAPKAKKSKAVKADRLTERVNFLRENIHKAVKIYTAKHPEAISEHKGTAFGAHAVYSGLNELYRAEFACTSEQMIADYKELEAAGLIKTHYQMIYMPEDHEQFKIAQKGGKQKATGGLSAAAKRLKEA